ncbi:hypothetical protein ACM16X_02545 [Haloarcula japonica]|uniref:hypothetical protein n=1 Tax=Haloarcula japonica TaxID=29282 RepID=UPI0039F6570F
MRSDPQVKLFTKGRLRKELESRKDKAQEHIIDEDDQTILTANEQQYIDQVVERYSVDPPDIQFDERYAEPEGSGPDSQLVVYFPYTGNQEMLYKKPSSYKSNIGIYDFYVGSDHIYHKIDAHRKDSDSLDTEIQRVTQYLRDHAKPVAKQVRKFNADLRDQVTRWFEDHKEDTREKHDEFSDLDIPIKKRDEVPETFSVPGPESRKQVSLSDRNSNEFKESGELEPELDTEIYREILQIIYDVGKGFERSPYLFQDKGEEDLRDYILFFLEAHFEGSVTGETFNKNGKTDILYRYDNSNLFVAECGIWDGPQWCNDKLDQLLNYLTWRDSKAALVVFVKRNKITPVLDKLDTSIREHPTFIEHVNEAGESWNYYKIHLPEDPEREVQLGVIAVHLPN